MREWRESVRDPAAVETKLRDDLASALIGRDPAWGRVAVEEVTLRGQFPTTKLVVIFRAESEAPGYRFGYWDYVWEDPDNQSLFIMYFDEAVNDYQPLRPHPDAPPGSLNWLGAAPPED